VSSCRAISNHAKDAAGKPVVLSTTKTLGDGSYVLNGLDDGSYTIDAFLPATSPSTPGASSMEAYQSKLDFFLAKAKPAPLR